VSADAVATIFNPPARGLSPELQKDRRPGSIALAPYLAREVVTAHGGTIDVRSAAEEGTVFTVRLPRRAATR
jgi:signal transduction histidine kinase